MDIVEKIRSGIAGLEDQEEALNYPRSAYFLARYVPGADIEKCQEVACRDSSWAYWFAFKVPGADIEKCQEAACKDPMYAYYFAHNVKGVDIGRCIEACRGSEYESELNTYLMDMALM